MASNQGAQRDPDEIRREIEQTRANMSRTVTVLEAKLNPQTLKQQAADTIREQTVGRVEGLADNASRTVKGAGADVFDSIKQNPLPATLAAIGLGWLFMESRNQSRYPHDTNRSSRRSMSGRYPQEYGEQYSGRYPADYSGEYGYEGRYGRGYSRGYTQGQPGGQGPMDRVRDAGGNVQDKASQMAGNVQDKAGEIAGNVQDTAGQVVDTVQQTAGQVASQAQQQAYQMRSRFEDLLEDNPLLVGAAAAVLGVMLGFSIPSTSKENEMFGPARDKVMDKAQDAAQDTMQKVQQVASKAGQAAKETAKDEAEKQHLTQQSSGS